MLSGYIGFHGRCGIGYFGEIDGLTCYDAVWIYMVSREMWNMDFCEIDDLTTCYDAVWLNRV
jgi:hypothetical protein